MAIYKSTTESDKAHARFGWLPLNQPPGDRRDLRVDQLLIDDAYQRGENEDEIRDIARDFNWAAFGEIAVAQDPNGKLYVIDGQQRTAAARRRGISTVPAMVHHLNQEDAARAFLWANSRRKPVNAVGKYKAELLARLPHAILVDQLLQEAGLHLKPNSNASNTGIRCISVLKKWAVANERILRKTWPLFIQLVEGGGILNEWVIDSICYMESRLEKQNKSILHNPWRKRIVALGTEGISLAAKKASAYYARGGAKVWASGLIDSLNHGKQHRLSLDAERSEVTT
jgi:hypothetical protein